MNSNGTEKRFVRTNNVDLYSEIAGPEDGKLLVLLHGFPEFSGGWSKQIQALAAEGYRVVAPNQRGYFKSSRPELLKAYTMAELAEDIMGLIRFFNRDRAVIIGHDWGGMVGWFLASEYPEYVEKLIVMNIPHPAVFAKKASADPLQWLRSSYAAFFQLPDWPEQLLGQNQFKVLKTLMRKSSNPGTFPEQVLAGYEEAWRESSLTGMLNWYRAVRHQPFTSVPAPDPSVPVRILWGRRDAALSLKLAKESLRLCGNGQMVLINEATHWLHREYPALVNEHIFRFLNE